MSRTTPEGARDSFTLKTLTAYHLLSQREQMCDLFYLVSPETSTPTTTTADARTSATLTPPSELVSRLRQQLSDIQA
ncbi:Htl1p KNAG_0I00490 [Huiozyma naganishii CBS 8797]|uniref:Uncharacterized protein n=1 Tax=Huiozyma naganishii (strain ATCC MYA-139 / BCRC 22969 / CBS 8797 / KCTC 17520 / NBRC 10181 / NCYC 3082 / Yp74L-3) TaxID=1071383 RepID=J7RAD6_HUIN7|nr:hypothetical protein KNAG_0I00490 [Kazachstania naganishii CBS 8797]CCK71840.1 hypothetical protein KNAG_0I00490 [Kazachstania naganishii CBS 8797]